MKRFTTLVGALTFSLNAMAAPQEIGPSVVYKTEGSFEDVNMDLKDAITERGMVISYTSHAKTMLDRTGPDLGVKNPVYKDEALIHLFCKADLSHKLVQSNPHNISLCPYAMAVYTLTGEEETVYVTFRKPYMDDPTYAPINDLLNEIAEEVTE